VTGGTRVLSDVIKVRITASQGSTFLDRMIRLVEGAERQKTPNEIALKFCCRHDDHLPPGDGDDPELCQLRRWPGRCRRLDRPLRVLIPTTIGALLSAIGIAGMDRLVRFNVLAMSGRAVEAAGDVDTLLLDKTGTITLGNRLATELLPIAGVSEVELADAAPARSLSDETPEGRSIVVLVKEKYGLRGRDMAPLHARFVPFSAPDPDGGVDLDGIRSARPRSMPSSPRSRRHHRAGAAERRRDRRPGDRSVSQARVS